MSDGSAQAAPASAVLTLPLPPGAHICVTVVANFIQLTFSLDENDYHSW